MIPDSHRPTDTDGGEPPTTGFDEAALYTIVRDAVKDALLDVIGTVLQESLRSLLLGLRLSSMRQRGFGLLTL